MKTLLMTSAAAVMLSVGAASAATSARSDYGNALSAPAFSQQYRAAPDQQPDFFGTVWNDEGVSTATGGPVGVSRGG